MSSTPANWRPRADAAVLSGRATDGRALAPRIDAQELRRRAWHMAPGFLPFILWGIPHADPLSPTIRWVFIGIFLVLTGALFARWSRVARAADGSSDRISAIYGYAGCVLLTLFLFPAHAQCGLAVLGVLAFGDGSATLIGKLVGGPRLPWNPAKSFAGLCGFLLVGVPMTALIYWGESHNLEAIGPAASLTEAVLVAGVGVLAGAIAESVRSTVNDNVRVGLAAAAAIVVAHGFVFGI